MQNKLIFIKNFFKSFQTNNKNNDMNNFMLKSEKFYNTNNIRKFNLINKIL